MEGKTSIKSVGIHGFLSFGRQGCQIDLQPLNLVIGPNASGKSNFAKSFAWLQSIAEPQSFRKFYSQNGGREYFFNIGKNWPGASLIVSAATRDPNLDIGFQMDAIMDFEQPSNLVLNETAWLGDRSTEDWHVIVHRGGNSARTGVQSKVSDRQEGNVHHVRGGYDLDENAEARYWKLEDAEQTSLSLFGRNSTEYALQSDLVEMFSRIWMGSSLHEHGLASLRQPQSTDRPRYALAEDLSNLIGVLNSIKISERFSHVQEYLGRLSRFNERYDIDVTASMGTLYLKEEGLSRALPASRLSDGTLRMIALLALVFQENPPSIIVLEEPEAGLHPDLIHVLGQLLIEASNRSQIVVTTHSDLLVSSVGREYPEAIIVCEKGEEGTTLSRLEPDALEKWIGEYTLGELWLRGEIGGTRW